MTETQWRAAVEDRALGCCEAQNHDPLCRLTGHHAHHVNYKSRIVKAAYWLVDNGVWLSLYCHALAHRTNNANIALPRRIAATIATNAAVPNDKPELLIQLPEAA